MDLGSLDDSALVALWVQVTRELRTRGLTRSSNNPVADFAERLVAERLGLELAGQSAAAYDALDSDGMRYQIKARRITPENNSRQLSAIRNLPDAGFDFLVAVLFDEDFQVLGIWRLPYSTVAQHAKYVPHTNSYRLVLSKTLLADPTVEELTATPRLS